MKRTNGWVWRCATAVLAVALGAQAQTNTVSRPAGFVRVAVPGRTNTLVALPFAPFDSGVNGVLGGQLTGGSNADSADQVTIWDSAAQAYSNAVLTTG